MSRWSLAAAFAVACQMIVGCAETPLEPYAGTEAKTDTMYVIGGGWHTEIGLPVRTLSGPLQQLQQAKSGATYVVFGWGQRDYYMAADPGFGDLMKAALSGPSVMLVVPLDTAPPDVFGRSNVSAIAVSSAGLARLDDYLWAELEKDAPGVPHPIAPGPYAGSAFYASTSTYEITHNCNTWTAAALRTAGLPVHAGGVVFASQVMDQVRKLERSKPDEGERKQHAPKN